MKTIAFNVISLLSVAWERTNCRDTERALENILETLQRKWFSQALDAQRTRIRILE